MTKRIMKEETDMDCASLYIKTGSIIRCKGCKHWDELLNMCGRTGRQALGATGFCSRAERKDNG